MSGLDLAQLSPPLFALICDAAAAAAATEMCPSSLYSPGAPDSEIIQVLQDTQEHPYVVTWPAGLPHFSLFCRDCRKLFIATPEPVWSMSATIHSHTH